jgi:hypothetical protein
MTVLKELCNVVLINCMTIQLFFLPSYCVFLGFNRIATGARGDAVSLKVAGSIPEVVIGIFH